MPDFLHYELNTIADTLLYEVCNDLGVDPRDPKEIYNNILQIRDKLDEINLKKAILVGTTGTITERLCEAGLMSINANYGKLPQNWKWVGDFYIESIPFNVIISVKSFKAKERLLSSGSGNYLSPTIGYGLFNDVNEFKIKRLAMYPFRAFIAIYMPSDTYNLLEEDAKNLRNINNQLFIRKLENFTDDLTAANDKKHKLDITKF